MDNNDPKCDANKFCPENEMDKVAGTSFVQRMRWTRLPVNVSLKAKGLFTN